MNDVEWDLLFRYLGKECTAEERVRFEAWLAADAKRRVIIEAATVAAGRTLASMPASSPPPRFVVSRGAPRRQSTWAFAAAACLMLVAGGTLLWRAHGASVSASEAVPALQVATTRRGALDTLLLHDGSRVVLGAASILRYPATFTGRSRDVYLTGEGYFEVVHDSQRPFRVHAGDATAEDLGTAFGVRAYAKDSVVQVVVAEGAVALGAARSEATHAAVLTRGQLGRLAKGSAVASVQQVNLDAYLGWTKGRLVFDETPLAEVAVQLERWYGTEFRIADTSHATHQLTASFANKSLPEVLAILSQTLDLRFERRGDTIVMHPQDRGR
jgi:transmembrane sensor